MFCGRWGSVLTVFLRRTPHRSSASGNVRLGIQEQEALLKKYDELAEQMGEPDADIDALIAEQASLQVRAPAANFTTEV